MEQATQMKPYRLHQSSVPGTFNGMSITQEEQTKVVQKIPMQYSEGASPQELGFQFFITSSHSQQYQMS